MKPSSNTADMTKGSPVRLILTFSVPLIIGNIFQQFYWTYLADCLDRLPNSIRIWKMETESDSNKLKL